MECADVVFEPKNRPNPRSPSLTIPSALTNIFAGLISIHRANDEENR